MSISYSYVEIEDFKRLSVGSGRSAWRHWGLVDHEGVVINLDYLGYPKKRCCYLPFGILKKLYTAFDTMNKYGGILFSHDLEDVFEDQKFGEEHAEQAHDNRTGCFTLDTYETVEGYIHLTPLLPELLDMDFLEKLYKDPALNIALFEKMHDEVITDLSIYKYRHGRWSPQWIDYCNKLVAENPELERFDPPVS